MEFLSEYPIRKVCQILNVRLSSFYYRRSHKPQLRLNKQDVKMVTDMFFFHFGNFGRRELQKELKKQDYNISQYKISKILKTEGLRSKYHRKKATNVHTASYTEEKYIAENLFAKLSEEEKKQEIWSMDFTEVKIQGKKVIICGIISVPRKILIAKIVNCKNTSESACKAVQLGIAQYGKPVMIMTDRGSPFVSKSFHDLLESNGIKHSMSRPHTPVDNRFIETFWKSMKTEIGKVTDLSLEDYSIVMDYYCYYYNYLRPHSTLGYLSPMEYNTTNFVI